MDRHDRDHKDAEDMFFILGKFYMTSIMDGQTPTDDVDDEEEVFISGAQWIASIMRSILSTDHLNYYSNKIKEELAVTSRCMPFTQENIADTCVCCGKPAKKMVYWGKAY